MRTRTRLLVLMLAAVVALLVTGAALAITGLTFNNTAPLSVNNTEATMTGTVTCDPTDLSVRLFAEIIQGKGRQFIVGSGSETEACPAGGGTISWTIVLQASTGETFQKGSATASVSAS